MNLTNFLNQTDTLTAQYTPDQLISFIHDIARVIPEDRREDFLKRLKAAGGKSGEASVKDTENESAFHEKYKLVRNNLKRIDSQEITVESVWNEEYDEWYDDSGEEVYYKDDSGISDMLEEACDFVHTCMDREKYKEGYEIGNQLFSMEILCLSDYGGEELSLGDMVYHGLLQYDLMPVCLDTAYCAYHAVPSEKRPEALYEVIVNARKSNLTLEAIMQHGDEELPDFQDFLKLWIAHLGMRTGREADRLILEAVDLRNDVSAAARYAKEYVTLHPGLYLSILENEKYADAGDMVSVGMEAIKLIPKKYIMRSRVALKTAERIMKGDENRSLLEKCYFTAYESDTSALNYLRALLNGYGTEEKREELQKVFAKFSVRGGDSPCDMFGESSISSERSENRPDSNTILLLRFFNGQFAEVLKEGLNKSEALGWSGTFMKQGIALFLLYLYEGKWTGGGITAMADRAKNAMSFSAEEYRKGTYAPDSTDDNELFYEVFLKWKTMTQMEAGVRARAIEKIQGLLEKRTDGIMSASRRNYYGECAAYIAALGEVEESLGELCAKQRLMTSYKERYSRRSAFREELRRYGWLDVKKK